MNNIFIIIAIGAVGYILFIVFRKFPQIAAIDVKRVPGAKDTAVKRKILEERLRRDIGKRVFSLKNFFGWERLNFNKVLQVWQDRLLQLEREYRRLIHKDLSTQVQKTKVLGDLVSNAKTYIDQGEYQKAEELLIDALSLNEHSSEAYFMLAQVYQQKKELDHARETLEYLLRLTHNEDPKVYQSLAQLSVERGNLREAEEDYLRSISLDENNYQYYFQLAGIYRDLEEFEKALEAAKKSLLLAPNNPKVLDFLVEVSIVMKDAEQGRDFLDRLIEVNPENQKVDNLRKRLEELNE